MAREASFWTAERDVAAQDLWRKGLSGREIARLVGAPSHSAVIGRMWRLGTKRSAHVAAANHRVAMALGRATAKAGSEEWQRATARLMRPPGGLKLVEAPLPPQTPVLCEPRPWLSRSENECAYPVAGEGDDVLSCCNTPVRGGYCEGHRAAMFRKPRGTFASVLKMQESRMSLA
ncbi:MAG: hypothetical protein JSR86_07760 [Proteobacteria bacterium]|nr:hypothetical protein [Pseudomonadota bacterium]